MDDVNNNNFSYFIYVNKAYEFASKSFEQLKKVSAKIDDLKIKYLTVDYLTTKIKDAIYATVIPLSNPSGWEEKMNETTQKLKISKTLRNKKLKSLKKIENKLTNNCLSNERKAELQKAQTKLNKSYQKIDATYEKRKNLINYLEQKKFLQVGSRFTGYVGMATNVVLPGSGLLVGVALTGASVVIQEKLTDSLSNQHQKETEKINVRYGTLFTVALKAASIAFSILVIPIIKEAIWPL